jgi:hypothetical protein
MLLKEFKDVFAWTYKDLKSIPLELVQHIIELDTSIPLAHHARYILNPNYVRTYQIGYGQTISNMFHSISRGGYMVITYNGST